MSDIDTFRQAGLEIEELSLQHWRLWAGDTACDYWPNSGKAMAFARVFVPASAEKLAEALTGGRISMPPDADKATCRDCGGDIWWTTSVNRCDPAKSGKKTPINADGTTHWGTCPRKQHRANVGETKRRNRASSEFLGVDPGDRGSR